VLICPGCYPSAIADLSRCARCDSVRLVKRLDQVECLDCHLTRDTDTGLTDTGPGNTVPPVPAARSEDADLAAEVASALARVLGKH
jgi:hypothetical protein